MIQSNQLELKQIDQTNRGLFTKKQLKPWSTIIQCSPICVSICSSMRNKFCNFCLSQKQVLRCSRCKVLYYCSTKCQSQDWTVHKLQCRIFQSIVTKKNIAKSKLSMNFMLNLRLYNLRNINQLINSKVQQMCHLLQFQPAEKLRQFQQTAIVLIQNRKLQRNQENISMLVRQQSIVCLNSFTIQDYLCNYESIGIGLYWPANYINHSCHPNCTQVFDGRNLKILANRPISTSQQITISYVPRLESWANKKKICRQGYLFQCFCQQCQVNKMFDQEIMFIKCPFCHEHRIVNKSKKNLNLKIEGAQEEQASKSNQNYVCQSCKKQITIDNLNQIVNKSNKLISIISEEQNNYQKVKRSLLELRKLISQTDPKFQNCIHKTYLLSLGKASQQPQVYSQSYLLLKEMIQLMPKWYRLNPQDEIPYVYIWRYAQLGKLAYNIQKYKKAYQCTQKAHEIVSKINFQSQLPQVKELKERHQQMKIGLSFNKAQIFRKNN